MEKMLMQYWDRQQGKAVTVTPDNPLPGGGSGGSTGGDAQPEHVLEPHTFTNDDGQQTGSMIDHSGNLHTQTSWQNDAGNTSVAVTVPKGYYPGGEENLRIQEPTLVAGNIAAGKQVFGLTGTFTSDATATAADMLAGKTAGVNGQMVTGSIFDGRNQQNVPTRKNVAPGGFEVSPTFSGYMDETTTFVVMDNNFQHENILATKTVFGLEGTATSDADATAEDIAQGKTAYVNGQKITGTAQPTTFSPSKQTVQTMAQAFNQSGESYVLLFNAPAPGANNNLLGLSITFMDDGDGAWEYEDGKNFGVSAMSFNVMVANGELIANHQTIDLDSASMTININNADLSGGALSFDIVFTPSAGTVTINNFQPMMSVDIWSY